MKIRLLCKTFAILFLLYIQICQATSLEDIFNGVNSYSNSTSAKAIQGQTMNYYTGGSLFMREPKKTYQLAAAAAPSWSAGCGGIDMFAGSFSFINKEQFVALLRNIGQNATGYAFKLAIQNLCPTCDNVMQALEATARAVNGLNINSCEMAEGLVNASTPDTWKKSESNLAKTYGNATNQFSDALDAWTNVAGDQDKASSTLSSAKDQISGSSDKIPEGNVTWKALQKITSIDDDTRQVYMSMLGTVVFDSSQGASPRVYPSTGITVQTLIGDPDNTNATLPIYKCSNSDCTTMTVTDYTSFKSLDTLVEAKLGTLADKIANRSEWGADLSGVIQFINATDIPVYKMVSVATSLNNADTAKGLISTYKELIAARYAQVYINSSVRDIRAGLMQLSATVDSTQADEIKKLLDHLDQINKDAATAVANAHTQTVSTFAITQEIQSMERALNNGLSPALQQSAAFGKAIGAR